MAKLQYKINVFEGPLDMLLSLISKHKLDIYDIPIAELLKQYLEQIEQLHYDNMEAESEFLEMAARLVRIKSASLLPKHEEALELKEELIGQLVEYRQCKEMAVQLSSLLHLDDVWREPMLVTVDPVYPNKIDAQKLLQSLYLAISVGIKRLPPKAELFEPLIGVKIVSVSSQVTSILKSLWISEILSFQELFSEKTHKSERIAAFLAVLELVLTKHVCVEGEASSMRVRLLRGGDLL